MERFATVFAIWAILVDYFITFPRFSVFAVFRFLRFSFFSVFTWALPASPGPRPVCRSLCLAGSAYRFLLSLIHLMVCSFLSPSFLPFPSFTVSGTPCLAVGFFCFFPEITRNCSLLDRSVLERSSVDRADVLMFFRSNFDVSGCFPMISETICFARFVTS